MMFAPATQYFIAAGSAEGSTPLNAFDHALPEQPYWYLGLLAVEPAAQGRGVGSALVRTGLERADRDGVPTFLETGTQPNVAFYERLGFGVTDEILLPGGPTHWGMTRPVGGR